MLPARLIDRRRLPTSGFLRALQGISPQALADLADAPLRDMRLEAREWRSLVAREFLLLETWALGRLMSSVGEHAGLRRLSGVCCLLPDHAVFVHLLRRAVPFAALGFPTWCGIRSQRKLVLEQAVSRLNVALGLGALLRVLPVPCRAAAKTLGSRERLLVVTGRRVTLDRLTATWPGPIVGAAGRCVITLGGDARAGYRKPACYRLPGSCSNIRALFLADRNVSSSATVRSLSGQPYLLKDVLSRIHPSAVLCHESVCAGGLRPTFLEGYRVLVCDSDGNALPEAGFGADPRYGWPGDYLV